MQVGLHTGLAVAAVGGHRARSTAGAPPDPFDGGCELRRVRDGARPDRVVHDDTVVVVDDLRLVAELDRPVDAALPDRPKARLTDAPAREA